MARFLAIDWEQQHLHVVQASTVRGGVRVEQALTWNFPEPLTALNAEAMGKKLRDALKEANVQTAPVLACVGREKVILKELRYPAVPANEEPSVVRFQAAKELTESPEDSIIDYTPMGNVTASEERHALAVVVRKEVVNSLQGLCRGLSTKLLAVTPRPSAVIGALDRSRQGKVPVGAVEALLVIGSRWADLGILRGQSLLFARSLGIGPNLANEVKRSLAVFNASADTSVQALFIASEGDEFTLSTRLQELLGMPIQLLDSFLEGDNVQVDKARRGRFTAAIGLLQLWADKPELGINFVSPKQPREVENPRKRQKVLAGILGVAALLTLMVVGYTQLAAKKAEEGRLLTELKIKEDEFAGMAQLNADITALRDWDNNSVSWINEFYDLTAKFPHEQGFRLTSISTSQVAKKTGKEKFVAVQTLNGLAPAKDTKRIKELVDAINKGGIFEAKVQHTSPTNTGAVEFQIKVNMINQPLDKYTTALVIPPPIKGKKIFVQPPSETPNNDPSVNEALLPANNNAPLPALNETIPEDGVDQ